VVACALIRGVVGFGPPDTLALRPGLQMRAQPYDMAPRAFGLRLAVGAGEGEHAADLGGAAAQAGKAEMSDSARLDGRDIEAATVVADVQLKLGGAKREEDPDIPPASCPMVASLSTSTIPTGRTTTSMWMLG
jgi:hypothetical protein